MSGRQFSCRKCNDGKIYTPDEVEEHRAWHKAQKEKRKSNIRTSRTRMTSPPSEVTCFGEIESPPNSPAFKKPKLGPAKKKRSTKKYDTAVVQSTANPGG